MQGAGASTTRKVSRNFSIQGSSSFLVREAITRGWTVRDQWYSVDRLSGRFALYVVNDIYLLRQNACTIYSHAHISSRDINLSTRAHAENSRRRAPHFHSQGKARLVAAYATHPRASSHFLPMTDADSSPFTVRRVSARARVTYVCDYKRNESSFAFSMARSLSVLVSDARVND